MPAAFADVTADSRQVRPGALFAAWAGTATDAHDFLGAAREAGAAAALVERAVLDVPLPQVVVTNGRRAAAVAAALCCDDPAAVLRLVAVTGTNGKTTSVHLLRHLLGADAPAGSIGTLGAVDGTGRVIPGTEALTTPGPVELQRTLARLREDGVRTVAMEASSHSLHQDRLYGLRFHAAVYTNFTRDHLDYHATEAAYLEAKLSLSTYLAAGGVEVVHADDPAWRALPPHTPRVTFSARGAADVRADAVAGDAAGTRFTLHHGARAAAVALPLLGAFNVENAVGAAAAALALGVPLEVVAERLGTASQVPGRMERLTTTPCPVLRDYAHTPDALERAITALRPLTGGRLIVVFGCGGDRDRGKRPVMGGIAARLADLPIVTSDNPRTEDPDRILDDIEEGMGETPHLRIVNRRKAIHRAIAIARPDDTVLLAGKGHETYQVVGRDKLPFDEGMIVAEAVAATVR
jgi:UDP-N-acetylmuramoyl-L-alanyl-D-glutamate--2,6-diaminopimelate ligase